MHAARTLFFIALGLFGLYAVEFGVVGILPAMMARYGIGVAQAGWLLWARLQPAPATQQPAASHQLAILRSPALWLAIAMTVCVFGAMFSVYSYAAEYLARQTGLGGEAISLLLVVFGVGGVAGNLLAGRWLGRHRARTALLYPLVLAAAYGVLQAAGSAPFSVVLPVCLLWGAALGGAAIGAAGMQGALWSGWLFTGMAVALVLLKVRVVDGPGSARPAAVPEGA